MAEIARCAVSTYSDAGDLVIDLTGRPDLPALHEAVRQGRNAVGVVASASVKSGQQDGEPRADALVVHGDAHRLLQLLAEQAGELLRKQRRLPRGVAVHPAACADLILTTRATAAPHGSRGRDELSAWAAVLRPGGFLVTATGGRPNAIRDLGSETVTCCAEAGLCYWQHIVALLVPIANGELRVRRESRCSDQRDVTRVVHQDVHVFRKPIAAEHRPAAGESRCAA